MLLKASLDAIAEANIDQRHSGVTIKAARRQTFLQENAGSRVVSHTQPKRQS